MEACHANDRHRADVGHVACALTEQATAQSRNEKFPYDATIADDEVYARSGPGNKPYYPTARLRKGDRVTVIRHDPGGWYMIEPPPGSFAWVRQEHVKRQEDRGIITGDSQVVAWVGTSFGDDHYVEQRRLQPGEEVAIIGEKTLKDERGEVSYLRIKSPKGHFRWIPGAKIVTSDKQLSAANARARGTDPFAGESKSAPVDMASHEPGEDSSVATDGKSVPAPKDPGRRPAPTPKDLENESPPARSTAPDRFVKRRRTAATRGRRSTVARDAQTRDTRLGLRSDRNRTARPASERSDVGRSGSATGVLGQVQTSQSRLGRVRSPDGRDEPP